MGQQGLGLMSQGEAQRLAVLQGVKGKTLSQAQAAQQLNLSVRHRQHRGARQGLSLLVLTDGSHDLTLPKNNFAAARGRVWSTDWSCCPSGRPAAISPRLVCIHMQLGDF